jgi:hypothetical protein
VKKSGVRIAPYNTFHPQDRTSANMPLMENGGTNEGFQNILRAQTAAVLVSMKEKSEVEGTITAMIVVCISLVVSILSANGMRRCFLRNA